MAGHSKWHNIKRRKAAVDAVRGREFAKVSRQIYVAVRNGGSDPKQNLALRAAIERAREINMPADTIERTIKKALGDVEGARYEEILYEGYAPGGVAVLVQALTDNRNRTAQTVRHLFHKHGGSLGESGSASYLFRYTGVVQIPRSPHAEQAVLRALDLGAWEVEEDEEAVHLYVEPDALEEVRRALEAEGIEVRASRLTYVPTLTVRVEGETAERVLALLEALDEEDEVQEVYANAEWEDVG
ncbi:MAG: YebC/PmpR family DNA-binding transcriptional regulator [Brockia lithotrophica]|nr:YebC/PmpR family DNA-binding transcriptional regulator [Brockia lithotrophica]